MKLKVMPHRRIPTRGGDEKENGFVIPIYNVHDGFVDAGHAPLQVDLTVCAEGTGKGPHLHLKRWGYFTCIKGNVRIVARVDGEYQVAHSGEDHDFCTVEIPAGVPARIENVGRGDAYVINTPSPAWRPDDQDEHPVEGWNPPS
jgi:dTDP-4-dehydrorhamnose 3,5-epimerase-like enzyme